MVAANSIHGQTGGSLSSDGVFQKTSARIRVVELSSGPNVIPKRARPGLADLRPHKNPSLWQEEERVEVEDLGLTTSLSLKRESLLNVCRRTVNLRRPERARNEGTTGPERLDDTRCTSYR